LTQHNQIRGISEKFEPKLAESGDKPNQPMSSC